jgi:hypothetical protein
MGMMWRLPALAVIVATSGSGLVAQEPPPRAFLLFIDDLHLDFRQTPRTRQLMKNVFARLARQGDTWSVVTTGTSSLRIQATSDLAGLAGTISRVTGNALKPAELIAPAAGMNGTPETQHRADVSFRVGIEALQQFAAARPGASLTVLYVTDGYDTRRVTGLQSLIDAAKGARATLLVIKPWTVVDGLAAGVPEAEWRAYVEATHTSLRTLAEETGGSVVFSAGDLDPALVAAGL